MNSESEFTSSTRVALRPQAAGSEKFDFEMRFGLEKGQSFAPVLPYAWASRAVRSKAFKCMVLVYGALFVAAVLLTCPIGSQRVMTAVRVVGFPIVFVAFAAFDRNLLKALASTLYVCSMLLARRLGLSDDVEDKLDFCFIFCTDALRSITLHDGLQHQKSRAVDP